MFKLKDIKQPKWDELLGFDFQFQTSLQALNYGLIKTEEELLLIKDELDKKISSTENLLFDDPEEQSQYIDFLLSRENDIIFELEQQRRHSTLIFIHSFLEGNLRSLSIIIEKNFNFKIKLNDLSGSDDYWKYFLYFTKVCEINKDKIEPYFQQLKDHKIVRNKILHSGGFLSGDDYKSAKKIKDIDFVPFNNLYFIKFNNSKYSKFIINLINKLFEALIYEIDNLYATHNKAS